MIKKAFTFFLLIFFSSAFAEEIDIKGIRLGMTKKEISALYPNGTDNFTIGGVSNSLGLRLLFHEDKLAEMTFYFDTSGFNNVISSVKYKYPNIKCVKITDPRMPCWPPTSFSIEMVCNVTDPSGNIITRLRVTGSGKAEFSEFKNDFGLAGRRAADLLSEELSTEVKNNVKLR